MEEQETKTTIPSSRKRQLEPIDPEQEREDERDSDSSPPPPKLPATNNFLDEIELHFQRSLANMKSSQKSPVPAATTTSDGSQAVNDQQTRDSPSPNQQSRLTPPTSSTSSSSLTSSLRRHGIHSNKPLPPPLKLASPTSESPSTVQSLYTHQHHHHAPAIRAPSVTQHQTIILPTVTTAGLTGLTRQSPPSSVTGPPVLTIANGLPTGGTSPPSVITYSSGGVAQIHTLPTISTATLGSGGAGVYIASPQFLSTQQALHQALSNGGSSSPKRNLASAATISGATTGGGATATTIPVANNTCGALAAVQLTPGGPLLALPSSVLQPSSAAGSSGHGRTRGRTLLTGLNLSSSGTTGSMGTAAAGTTVASGGSYQIHAPSVTQPGSVHIIDLPIESSAGKSSPPTPLLASAPTLPKAPAVVNVSQIPNLIAINPSSPNSPSPSGSNKSTPTVKVVGTGSSLLTAGTQSPIRVSSASAQTTPVATPTLITPQQLAANPSLMSVIDPTVSAQLLAAGNTGCNPVYLIPANNMPMVQQPFFIINPSTTTATDLTSIQQLQQANILASNPSLAGASFVSNPTAGGGYLLVSPGSAGTAANFSMPLVNLASTTSVNSSQPAIPNLIPTSPAVTATTLKPASKATILYNTTASSSGAVAGGSASSSRPSAAKPPLKNQSSTDSASSPAHSDVMMTPASVDDHFAQALGPQWNKLKSHNNMQPQQC